MINVKQRELAKSAGISLATLNNIERGVGDPRSSTLEAIEHALSAAGITFTEDDRSESVELIRLARPNAYDTYFASQRVLELLRRGSLTKIEKVLFFARWARTVASGEDRHRICLLIEGENRSVLFDQVNFNVGSISRAAEVAGIMLAAFALHRYRLCFLDEVLEDTTTAEQSEAFQRLRNLPWQPLDHPKQFFNVFDNWDARLAPIAKRKGHPMNDLVALVAKSEAAEA
jgi:transcriptional regulator with XRE-family HTH domain